MVNSSPYLATTIVLLVGFAVTAIMTPLHGDAGTSADIAERSEWTTIHVIQVFGYSLIGIGALAYAFTPGRTQTVRLGLILLSIGSLVAGLAHIVDGPFRAEMIANGIGDGDPMYNAIFAGAAWVVVVAYAFVGIGGAIWAGSVASNATGAGKVFAFIATVFYAIGAVTGTAELGLVPGILFLLLAIAWMWSAVHLGLTLRNGQAAPAARAVSRGAQVRDVPRSDDAATR